MPERIDDLILGGLKIIQDPKEFCFSIDAVLLAHFPYLKEGMKVIDLGTGTGVIPLILMAREKKLSEIIGLEYQGQMVDMARRSVAMNNLTDKIEIIQGDIKKASTLVNEKFDLVLTNPPYMPLGKGKVNPQSSIAMARHEILITLPEIIESAAKILKHGGKMVMVHQTERLADIIYYCRENKLEPKRIRMIHPMKGKKSNLVLLEAVLGGGKGLEVLESLYVYEEKGKYSAEVLRLYGLTKE